MPKTYADFAQHKDWAGHVAIDSTDSEWLWAMVQYFGEDKATALIKDIVAAIQPVTTDGHLAQARSVGSGEYWVSLNNFVNLTMNVKLAGGPIDYFPLDPVALTFGAVGISAKAPHPNTALLAANFLLSQEAQTFLAKFGRIPTRADVEIQPARHRRGHQQEKSHHRAADGRRRAQMAEAVRRIVQGAVKAAALSSSGGECL